ncbi:MAG TPA: hypothetical protein VMH79_00475 [Thermoanaerobaculia bacterium]|nr:hypothetical protein [Thermoanaerobaculia bacterium]
MSERRVVSGVGRSVVAAGIAFGLMQAWPSPLGADARKVVVRNVAELEAAMVPGNAGKRIEVRAGVYDLGNALTVPDGATVIGDGVMTLGADGLPAGFKPNGKTLLRATSVLAGDILTLGDGATLRRLAIEDFSGRAGNPVVVASRSAGDSITAKILECDILNPNPPGITPPGPIGRSLVVMTRNPNLGDDPPPHVGATLSVTLADSILRSPGAGYGVFAINFAANAKIDLVLRHNVIGGGVNASGGVSRPDAVSGASVGIESHGNLYRSDSAAPTAAGWSLIGGTTAPLPGLVSQASTDNTLRLSSRNDRIEGFDTGVSAVGGQRSAPFPEPSSGNEIEVKMRGARLQSVTSDLALYGAASFVDGVSPGDDNEVRVKIRQSVGSGPRANVYADSWSPTSGGLGQGNRLRIAGSSLAFANSNEGFEPPPGPEFFDCRD